MVRKIRKAGAKQGPLSEEDWFEHRLENDPRFLRLIEQARDSLRTGRGVRPGRVAASYAFVARVRAIFA
jgi:hypothetical protein